MDWNKQIGSPHFHDVATPYDLANSCLRIAIIAITFKREVDRSVGAKATPAGR
jgi:hypothetical protein